MLVLVLVLPCLRLYCFVRFHTQQYVVSQSALCSREERAGGRRSYNKPLLRQTEKVWATVYQVSVRISWSKRHQFKPKGTD